MASICAAPGYDLGLINGLLNSVDCNARAMSEAGYGALAQANSPAASILTAMLTLYIAFIGYRMLLGRSPIRVGDLTISVFKIAVVIALATSWPIYQKLIFDTLFVGPEQLAALVLGGVDAPDGESYAGLQAAFDRMQTAAAFFARISLPSVSPFMGGAPFAAFAMNSAAYLMLLGTLGLVLVAKIMLGLLLAFGPVFIAFFLFDATRGLFVGWLRAAIAFALLPIIAQLALVIQLVSVEPQLARLAAMGASGDVDLPAATATFILTLITTGVSLAGVIGVGIIATALKLPGRTNPTSANPAEAAANTQASNRETRMWESEARRVEPRVAAIAAAAAAMERREMRGDGQGTLAQPVRRAIAPRRETTSTGSVAAQHAQSPRRAAQARHAASQLRRDR